MSTALLRALTRPLSLRVKEVNKTAQLALTLTTTTRKRCLLNKIAVWQAVTVRCCSGSTTFKQHSFIIGAKEDSPQQDVTAPHQTDLHSPATSDNFLLPSQQQRHQSDLLVAKIKNCETAIDAFEVYEQHSEVMETRHCLALIGRLGELVLSRIEDKTQLVKEEHFRTLCGKLYIQCRRMEVDELVNLMKHLCRLQVPATSQLTQAVLQMIKNQINDLSLKQLIFLEFLLKKMTLTPLSDALLTAIPMLISNALTSTHLADLSFSDMTQAFTTCCHGKVEGVGVLLQEMYHRGSAGSASLAMSLVWTLTEISSPRLQDKLLTKEEQLTREVIMKECLETLAQETDALTEQKIDSTLTKVCNGYDLGDHSCYNERFLGAVASYTCRHSVSFERAAHTIRKMLKMNYLSDELIHYTVDLILSRPEDVPESRVAMLPLISAITATALPRHDMKAVLDVIMTHKSLRLDTEENYKKPLLAIATELFSTGYYHPQLVDLLTSSATLSLLMSKYSKDDVHHSKLLEVDQFLGEVFQSSKRIPECFLESGRKLIESKPPSKSTLKAILHQLLQDPNLLVSGVVTQGGTYIDHLLVLGHEGVPVALRGADVQSVKNLSINTLDIPSDATKLAILDVGSGSCYRPTSTLKGIQRLRQHVLEAAGFKVLPMLQSFIFMLHAEEKVLYVKKELREAGVNVR